MFGPTSSITCSSTMHRKLHLNTNLFSLTTSLNSGEDETNMQTSVENSFPFFVQIPHTRSGAYFRATSIDCLQSQSSIWISDIVSSWFLNGWPHMSSISSRSTNLKSLAEQWLCCLDFVQIPTPLDTIKLSLHLLFFVVEEFISRLLLK